MEKFCPAPIPVKSEFKPESRIVVKLFAVETEQFANTSVTQVIALASTPDSVSFRLNQSKPEALLKNSAPVPSAGVPKAKFSPTGVQPCPQGGSRMMMVGSVIESAWAKAAHMAITTRRATRKRIEGFTE